MTPSLGDPVARHNEIMKESRSIRAMARWTIQESVQAGARLERDLVKIRQEVARARLAAEKAQVLPSWTGTPVSTR